MKSFYLFVLVLGAGVAAQAQFTYIHPRPDSRFHQPKTNIILRAGSPLDEASVLNDNWLIITGSKSGTHQWRARLSQDRRTITVRTQVPFNYDEQVTVVVKSRLRKADGSRLAGLSFAFSTRLEPTPEQQERYRTSQIALYENPDRFSAPSSEWEYEVQLKKELPFDSLANYSVTQLDTTAPGYVFFNSKNQFYESNSNSVITIIENNGKPKWLRDLGINGQDFKINHSGYITYFNYLNNHWVVLDSNLKPIDSIQCKNGYEEYTNAHDIQWYPDNHILLMAYDKQTIDMSQVVPGGHPQATVKGFVLQELDADREVVFEWRSWDHFNITDAVSTVILTNATVDYCHGNSMERDVDGNIILSFRHLSEITKISRETGEILWRMGGENNQFTFINDTSNPPFSYQHDARRTASGTLLLYNNANYMNPQRSNVKEYLVDEVNKTATLVWYYEHPDVNGQMVYGRASGNSQRLPNGNTLINWGNLPLASTGLPNFTEVDSAGNILWELKFDIPSWISYRAFRFEWDPCSRVTYHTMEAIVKFNNTTLTWQKAIGARSYELQYRPVGQTNWTSMYVTQSRVKFNNLSPSTTYEWRVKTICGNNPYRESGFTDIATFTTMARFGETDPQPEFTLFPNPAKHSLNWNLLDEPDQPYRIRICDLHGKSVLEEEFQPGDAPHLRLSGLVAGTYMVYYLSEAESRYQPLVIE
ncbi:MAG: arylsulfotransferase family protein [Chitinophagales bacterium]|nr:aryl-sulfate sulfotransferase [Chitinophagales bacterium]MDW8392673.1 arylsulfotransferase family protein [Chitinophagales bacterium]